MGTKRKLASDLKEKEVKVKRKCPGRVKKDEKYAAKLAKRRATESQKQEEEKLAAMKSEEDDAQFTRFESKKATRKRKRREEADEEPEVESQEPEETRVDAAPPPQEQRIPDYPPIKREKLMEGSEDMRKVAVPSHRYSPLKENWLKIFTPVVEYLHLQIRFNLRTRNVEIRSSKETKDIGALQKAADFVRAFTLGFDVDDALALVRLDDLFLESFQVTDVKPLKGDHLSRAIGRIAGKGGKTRFTIENVTKTRIVLADSKIHILGSYQNIQIARRAICNLILGSPPSKVYGNLRSYASRASARF